MGTNWRDYLTEDAEDAPQVERVRPRQPVMKEEAPRPDKKKEKEKSPKN